MKIELTNGSVIKTIETRDTIRGANSKNILWLNITNEKGGRKNDN